MMSCRCRAGARLLGCALPDQAKSSAGVIIEPPVETRRDGAHISPKLQYQPTATVPCRPHLSFSIAQSHRQSPEPLTARSSSSGFTAWYAINRIPLSAALRQRRQAHRFCKNSRAYRSMTGTYGPSICLFA